MSQMDKAKTVQLIGQMNDVLSSVVERYENLLEDPGTRGALGEGLAVVECVLHDCLRPALQGLLELHLELSTQQARTAPSAFLETVA